MLIRNLGRHRHPACYLALGLEVAMGLAYAAGAWVYINRVPERWRPGVFDVVGHSHQIFHVLVLVGAATHYVAGALLIHCLCQEGEGGRCLCRRAVEQPELPSAIGVDSTTVRMNEWSSCSIGVSMSALEFEYDPVN
jgi:hypothetical protein